MTTATLEVKVTEIGALKARVLSFPRALYDARLIAADADKRVKELQGDVKNAENEATLFAAADPVNKNEQARKAAAVKDLADNAEHRALLATLAAAESDAMNARLNVGRLEDEHKAFRAVADLTIAEVQLLCAGR